MHEQEHIALQADASVDICECSILLDSKRARIELILLVITKSLGRFVSLALSGLCIYIVYTRESRLTLYHLADNRQNSMHW